MKIYLLAISIGLTLTASSQNLEIRNSLGAVVNNTIVTHSGTPSDFEIVADEYNVFNIGSDTVNVRCKRIELVVLSSTATALCWKVCSSDYTASVSPILIAPSSPVEILAATSHNDFSLHYKPLGVAGLSTFRVVFYNVADANDTASFFIHFDAVLSVSESVSLSTSINAYPNPANNSINIDIANFNDNATLRIVDALGVTVKTAQINGDSNLKFNTSDLREGVYFYSLITNNKTILTRRMIITR